MRSVIALFLFGRLLRICAALYTVLWDMPNFHALAVFEACGSSTEEIQESVSSLFASFSHQRVRYHEHELSAGPSAAPAGKSFYCMVFIDCDVDAYTEEKALDFANDAFEYISTEACQYLAFGLVPGRQRVQRRREEASDTAASERGGRRRGTPGRGRRRRDEQERDRGARQETDQTQVSQGEVPSTPAAEPGETPPAPEPEIQAVAVEPEEVEAPTELEVDVEAGEPPAPPPRSSAAMQVTVTVKLRASELKDALNGEVSPAQQDLVQMAIAEARNRHPEVPADVAPESESTPLPGGDTLLSLTWKYPAPVLSSKESAS